MNKMKYALVAFSALLLSTSARGQQVKLAEKCSC